MKRFLRDRGYLTLLGVACVFWLLALLLNPFASLKNRSIDLLFDEFPPSGDIVLIKIDDRSVNRIGQWPWPRAVLASLIPRLEDASVIGIDISLAEPSRLGTTDDQALDTALEHSRAPVVLPVHMIDSETTGPSEVFAAHTSQGFSNLPIDPDGISRMTYAARGSTPSFSYAVSSLYKPTDKHLEVTPNRLYRIHFHGRNTTYPDFSFIDVLDGNVPKDLFKGRIVLVGVTASGLGTFINTPFGLISSLEVQANAIDTFEKEMYYTSFPILDAGIILLMTLLGGFASLYARRAFHILGALAGILVLYFVCAVTLFDRLIIIDPLYPPLAALGTVFIATTYQYITTLRREQVLRGSYDTLNSMVASMTEGVAMVDKMRHVVAYNLKALEIIGVSPPSAPSFSDIILALGKRVDIEAVVASCMSTRRTQSFREIRFGDRFFQITVAPVYAPTGERGAKALVPVREVAEGAVILFYDMTDQKEIERVREDFISMLVHELRSPLDVMRKMAEVLASPPESFKEERRDQYLTLINTNATRTLDLVNNLLDVAKIEAGKFEIHKTNANVRTIIADRIAFYTPLAEGMSLESHIEGTVPQEILLDPQRIVQVLNNLLSNAIKFTNSGGHVSILASMCSGDNPPKNSNRGTPIHWFGSEVDSKSGQNIVLEVFNSGSEITSEDLPYLFDKFKQFEAAAKSSKKGTGLGLAIARGIVEEHGGIVGVSSGAGGTSFLCKIPTT